MKNLSDLSVYIPGLSQSTPWTLCMCVALLLVQHLKTCSLQSFFLIKRIGFREKILSIKLFCSALYSSKQIENVHKDQIYLISYTPASRSRTSFFFGGGVTFWCGFPEEGCMWCGSMRNVSWRTGLGSFLWISHGVAGGTYLVRFQIWPNYKKVFLPPLAQTLSAPSSPFKLASRTAAHGCIWWSPVLL